MRISTRTRAALVVLALAPLAPVWEGIPAVADGREHQVEDDTWMLGIGPIGAGIVLDDVESELVG